jgi:hypothetical protein
MVLGEAGTLRIINGLNTHRGGKARSLEGSPKRGIVIGHQPDSDTVRHRVTYQLLLYVVWH